MGTTIEIPRCFGFGALRRGDRDAVARVFDGLGERSRRLRFGGPKPHLAERELTWLADVDGSAHGAVVAVDCHGEAVGIARFVRSEETPAAAEVAFEVVDGWQGRGVGTRLARELAELARAAGIERFTALVAAGNAPSLRLLRGIGTIVSADVRDGEYELVVRLHRPPLRAAA
jgi:RimJ/RimL family protein N-acetyltransferase